MYIYVNEIHSLKYIYIVNTYTYKIKAVILNHSICGSQNNGLQRVHLLIPGVCEYVTLHAKGIKVANGNKIAY